MQKKIIRYAWAILLAWASSATGAAFYLGRSYNALQASLAESGQGELLTVIEHQRARISELQDDLGAAEEHIRAADRDARDTDELIRRAYELAKSSDDGFIEFRDSMDGVGRTIQDVIARQQRIDHIIRASEEYNRAIKMELGMRLRKDN